MGESTPEDLKKRVKELLNESSNKRCSECRSKKHKPKFFSLLKTPERGQLGVFCCKNCSEFHLALGADYATVKSLKHPEEWTEQDVETLETSGNEAVNKIYESGMHGNHTDKHMGALASAAFVESKYKMCLYFSSEVYEEQMQLRAMALFAKEGKAREQPPPPTTEDKVKIALRRQTMISSKPAGNNEEPVLLRGFGSSSPTANEKDEEDEEEEVDEEEYQRRINAARPRLERKGSIAARRAGPRRAVSADGGIPVSGPLRRTKKPVSVSDARKPIRRSNTHEFDNSSHRNGGHRDLDMSKSRSRRNLLDSSEASRKSRRHLINNGQRPARAHRKAPSDGIDGNSGHRHRSNSRGHRKGPSEGIESSSGHRRRSHRSADGDRLRRTHTAGEPSHREKSGQAIRRTNTESGHRPRKGPKRVESSSKQKPSDISTRGDEIPSRSMRKSRERSVSPAPPRSGRTGRTSSPKEAMWERSGRKQREHGGDRSQRSSRSNSSSYSEDAPPSESLLEDEESTVEVSSEDDEITVTDSVVKKRESWSQHIDSLTRGKGKVKESKKLDENSEKDLFKEKGSAADEKAEENEQGEEWTNTSADSIMWSRNVHKPAKTKKKKRPSGKSVVGDNKLGQSTTAIFQKAFANPAEPEKVKQPKETRPSWVDELAHVSEHDLGVDISGFSTSFVDMGFGDFGGTNQGDDDDDDGLLLQGIALSSQ